MAMRITTSCTKKGNDTEAHVPRYLHEMAIQYVIVTGNRPKKRVVEIVTFALRTKNCKYL